METETARAAVLANLAAYEANLNAEVAELGPALRETLATLAQRGGTAVVGSWQFQGEGGSLRAFYRSRDKRHIGTTPVTLDQGVLLALSRAGFKAARATSKPAFYRTLDHMKANVEELVAMRLGAAARAA
jgi:hypothetical protein